MLKNIAKFFIGSAALLGIFVLIFAAGLILLSLLTAPPGHVGFEGKGLLSIFLEDFQFTYSNYLENVKLMALTLIWPYLIVAATMGRKVGSLLLRL